MSPDSLRAELLRDVEERVFADITSGGRLRCTVPTHYVDGTPIEIYVEGSNGSVEVSDLSETFRWLASYGVEPEELYEAATEACAAEGVALAGTRIKRTVADVSDIPDAVWGIASAAGRIADAVLYRRHEPPETREKVARPRFATVVRTELFSDVTFPVEVRPHLPGGSGKTWHPDFFIPHEGLVLDALGSAHGNTVNSKYAELADLSRAIGFVTASVIDDTRRSWKPEIVDFLGQVGDVYRWSQRQALAERLEISDLR